MTTLAELHAAGRLAARYPEVPALLSELDEAGMRRAGTLLSQVDSGGVLELHPGLPVVTVAVVGSSSLQPLQAPLTAQLARHGFLPRISLGGYRQYPMELLDPGNPVFEPEPDLTICLLDAEEVFGRVATPWTAADVGRALDELYSTLTGLIDGYHRAPLVLNTIPLPQHRAAQLVDHRSRALLGAAWREFNAKLLRLPGIVVIDSEPLVASSGPLLDPRLASYAKIQFSDEFFACYAREIGHLARSLRGKTSKCLVLDLDGTVWGGVLAEDGPEGVEVGDGYRGEAFTAFQTVAKQLAAQGPLLTVCSKNDEDLVRKALSGNERMVLREEDFVAVVANWGAKPDNLTQIAEQLNIGVDSLVFVDDSPSERGLVRTTLPAVPVVAVDAGEPALHLHRLLADGWFTTQEVTDEDRVRGERYRTERKRLEFAERAESLADYLTGLGTTVELFRPSDVDVARIAQITQRTNQFNLTTIRLDAAAVRAKLEAAEALFTAEAKFNGVFAIRCADRFGEHGVVGAVFTSWDSGVLRIENFLLSCRVLARGVEQAVLHTLLTRAAREGAPAVSAAYRPTAKNHKVADLYPSHGFRVERRTPAEVEFVHDLNELPPAVPYVEIIVKGAER